MGDVFARSSKAKDRDIRACFTEANAATAIGAISHGCEIYGLSKGAFSLVDILRHCLRYTGPAHVIASTWTAANADLGFAYQLLADGAIASMQFVVDFSFPVRQPEYCAALRERFGDASVRLTKNHAKFICVYNDVWNIVIRTSMNLNENRRLESFEISDDAGLCGFLRSVVAELFADHADGEQFAKKPYDNTVDFERWGESSGAEQRAAQAVDKKKYFGDGRADTDVRRAGMSYARTGARVRE